MNVPSTGLKSMSRAAIAAVRRSRSDPSNGSSQTILDNDDAMQWYSSCSIDLFVFPELCPIIDTTRKRPLPSKSRRRMTIGGDMSY